VEARRWTSDTSSDGFDVEMDATAENDDDLSDLRGFDDELFRRIMANERRKYEHAYRLSYEQDVGSSFDPNMVDVGEWEAELKVDDVGSDAVETEDPPPPEEFDIDDDELAAWYDEYVFAQEREQAQQVVSGVSDPSAEFPGVSLETGLDQSWVASVSEGSVSSMDTIMDG